MILDTPNGPKEISDQEYMKAVVRSAWDEYEEILAREEESGFDDAMLSMDRTRAEGYAEGLGRAYHIFYKESYDIDSKDK
jgi:hypothetical protein